MKMIFKILTVAILLLVTSCGSKKIINQVSEKEKTTITKSDSVKIVERNRAIVDSLKFKIAQSATGDKKFDDAVNKAVSEILNKLNTSKSSGDNSYSLTYDDVLKELRAVMNIAPTENTIMKNNNIYNEKETVITEKEIPVKFIPQYVLAASIFGGCCALAFIAWIGYKASRLFKPKVHLS